MKIKLDFGRGLTAPPPKPPPTVEDRLKLTKAQHDLAIANAKQKSNHIRVAYARAGWKSWADLSKAHSLIIPPNHASQPFTFLNVCKFLDEYILLATAAMQAALTAASGVTSTAEVKSSQTSHHEVVVDQFILRPQQKKSVDLTIENLWVQKTGNAVLLPLRTGAGKSIIAGAIIKYIQDNKWFGRKFILPQAKVVFITKKPVVIKIIRTFRRMGIKNVGQNLLGNDVCVTHYGALRTKQNERLFEEFETEVCGSLTSLYRYRGEHPVMVILDESQEIKRWDSDRTQRVWAFHHHAQGSDIKWMFTSATPGVVLNDMMAFAVFAHAKANEFEYITRDNFPAWVRRFECDPRKPNGRAMGDFLDYFGSLVVSPPNDPMKVKAVNKCTLITMRTEREREEYFSAEAEYIEAVQRVGRNVSERGLAMTRFMILAAKEEQIKVPYMVENALAQHKNGYAPVIALRFQESVRDTALRLIEAGVKRENITIIWGGDKAITEDQILKSDEAREIGRLKVDLDGIIEFINEGLIDSWEGLKERATGVITHSLLLPDGDFDKKAAKLWVYEQLLQLPIVRDRYPTFTAAKLLTRYRKWAKYTYDRVKRDETYEEAANRRAKLANLRIVAMSDEQRQADIDKFQDGTTEFCIFTLSAGGTGVDLDHQIPHARPRHVQITPCYWAEEFKQAFGRCMRIATLTDVVQEVVGFEGTLIADHLLPRLMKKVQSLAKFNPTGDDLVSVLESAILKGEAKLAQVAEVVDETAVEIDDTEGEEDED